MTGHFVTLPTTWRFLLKFYAGLLHPIGAGYSTPDHAV
jgi:hypothetical protein